MGGGSATEETQTVDYSKFDPKFTNEVESIGPEWGELHQRREQWLKAHRESIDLIPEVPDHIPGLLPKTGRLPITTKWYRRTSSFERNGFLNIQTPVFNTKWLGWSFPIFLLWGWVSFQVQGANKIYYNDADDRRNNLYWKMQCVELPQIRLWNRPG